MNVKALKLFFVLGAIFFKTLFAHAAVITVDGTFDPACSAPFSITLSSTAWTLVPASQCTGGQIMISLVNKATNTGVIYGVVDNAATTTFSTSTPSILLNPSSMGPFGLSSKAYLYLLDSVGAEVVTGQSFKSGQ